MHLIWQQTKRDVLRYEQTWDPFDMTKHLIGCVLNTFARLMPQQKGSKQRIQLNTTISWAFPPWRHHHCAYLDQSHTFDESCDLSQEGLILRTLTTEARGVWHKKGPLTFKKDLLLILLLIRYSVASLYYLRCTIGPKHTGTHKTTKNGICQLLKPKAFF